MSISLGQKPSALLNKRSTNLILAKIIEEFDNTENSCMILRKVPLKNKETKIEYFAPLCRRVRHCLQAGRSNWEKINIEISGKKTAE